MHKHNVDAAVVAGACDAGGEEYHITPCEDGAASLPRRMRIAALKRKGNNYWTALVLS